MRLQQVINEIREKLTQPGYRAVYDICQIVSHNRALLSAKMDPEDLNVLLKDLENLSDTHPANYHSAMYERESRQVLNRLMFFLDRMI